MSVAKKNASKTGSAPPRNADDEKLSAFCRTASHELGNVLGTIVGELDYGLAHTNTLVRYRAMNVAHAAAERAISLARNLAYFAVHPQVDPRSTDVSQLLLDTVEMVEKDLRHRNIKLQVLIESARTMILDPGATQQILLNLFRRSSETMPQGGKITLSLRQNGNRMQIASSDTGVGIPPERLSDPTSIEAQGLELAVAKMLVERQGGELQIESHPGDGTKYTLSFPYDPHLNLPNGFVEHRKFRRVKARLPVELSFNGKSPFTSEIRSLSIRGCFVSVGEGALGKLPQIDSTCTLRIYYYQDQVLDIAKCRIANHAPVDGTPGIGIEFVDMAARARKLLEAIVKSHAY